MISNKVRALSTETALLRHTEAVSESLQLSEKINRLEAENTELKAKIGEVGAKVLQI